jgi:hypothetical protein
MMNDEYVSHMYHMYINMGSFLDPSRLSWDPMGSSRIEAMMCNEGQIFAFDRDGRRLKTMMTLMQQRHVTCVEPAEKAEWPEWPEWDPKSVLTYWMLMLDMLVLIHIWFRFFD